MARKEALDASDETVRLLAVLVRLQLPNQRQAIMEMARVGIATARIAELLGTTPNTVNVTIQKAKKQASPTEGQDA